MSTPKKITNTEDVIDSRDVIARIEHLESELGDPSELAGCFDGTRGLEITMTLEQAQSASHQGQCEDDVAALVSEPDIPEQLDALDPEDIRAGLKEIGAWDEEELSDDQQNRRRAVWLAACDINERYGENSDEWEELAALKALAEEADGYAPDWADGATLVRESYFEDYARELAEDIGAIKDEESWPYTCIDWAKAASDLQQAYTAVEFGDVTYWVR